MKFAKLAILPSVVVGVLLGAGRATAQISVQKNSADFAYQYNGDTVPSASGGWGNTGYGVGGGGAISGLTLSSDGNILSTTPTQGSTILNFISTVAGQPWRDNVTDATGHTWEISLRQKKSPDEFPQDIGTQTLPNLKSL